MKVRLSCGALLVMLFGAASAGQVTVELPDLTGWYITHFSYHRSTVVQLPPGVTAVQSAQLLCEGEAFIGVAHSPYEPDFDQPPRLDAWIPNYPFADWRASTGWLAAGSIARTDAFNWRGSGNSSWDCFDEGSTTVDLLLTPRVVYDVGPIYDPIPRVHLTRVAIVLQVAGQVSDERLSWSAVKQLFRP